MKEYLVGIMYHEPKAYQMWLKGVMEDYESSTGVFIEANSEEEALKWSELISSKLFQKLNPKEDKEWKDFEYSNWVESDPASSCWNHCLDFFQRIKVGELPDFSKMGTDAYGDWVADKRQTKKS